MHQALTLLEQPTWTIWADYLQQEAVVHDLAYVDLLTARKPRPMDVVIA